MLKLAPSQTEQAAINMFVTLLTLPYYVAILLYCTVLRILMKVTGQYWLADLIPIWLVRTPRFLTTKLDYQSEKQTYKLLHNTSSSGVPLKRMYYYHYRYIARKYSWSYIKEAYDRQA